MKKTCFILLLVELLLGACAFARPQEIKLYGRKDRVLAPKLRTDVLAAAEAYYQQVHQCIDENDEEVTELKQKLDELVIPFSNDPAFVAQLKFERDAALLKKRKRTGKAK